MSDPLTKEEVQEMFSCMFSDIGAQIGDVLHCIVTQEIASHMDRITQLQGILGGTCTNGVNQTPS
jgi:hypothetical protein